MPSVTLRGGAPSQDSQVLLRRVLSIPGFLQVWRGGSVGCGRPGNTGVMETLWQKESQNGRCWEEKHSVHPRGCSPMLGLESRGRQSLVSWPSLHTGPEYYQKFHLDTHPHSYLPEHIIPGELVSISSNVCHLSELNHQFKRISQNMVWRELS